MKPTRQFDGRTGQYSTGSGSPETLNADLDSIFKMFNPDDTTAGIQGGIGAENLKAGAVSDTAAGNRTIDQSITATASNTGTITFLMSWLAKIIRAVTGKANWFDMPAKSIEVLNTELGSLTDMVNDNEADIENKVSSLTSLVNTNESDIESKVSGLTATVSSNKADIEGRLSNLAGVGRTTETVKSTNDDLQNHKQNMNNPHSVKAAQIDITPIASSPSKLQGALEWLKQQMDNIVAGAVPEGSIGVEQLSFNPATLEGLNTVSCALHEHKQTTASQGAHGLDAAIAKYKNGTGIYTTRGTLHAVIEPFCNADSFVTVAITSTKIPQGKWIVDSQEGQFTITSTKAEIEDILFNYYITKAVG